jgi:hypothetical protein
VRLLPPTACALLVALGPLPARADVELEAGVRADGTWTDNVFGVDDEADKDSDFSVRTTPWVTLDEDDGAFRWDVRYAPAYEYFLQESELRGFDHDASGKLSWQVGERTRVYASEHYSRFRTLSRFNETVAIPGGGTGTVVESQRRKLESNDASVGIAYELSRLDEVSLTVVSGLFDYGDFPGDDPAADRQSRTDKVDYLSAAAVYSHILSRNVRVGAQAFWRSHEFEYVGGFQEETDYYGAAFSWNQVVDRTLRFDATAGPAYVVPDDPGPETFRQQGVLRFPLAQVGSNFFFFDARTCPRGPGGVRIFVSGCRIIPQPIGPFLLAIVQSITGDFETVIDADVSSYVTFFAEAALTKEWTPNWKTSLSYERRDDQAAGNGVSSIADTVTLTSSWRPSPRWVVDASGSWVRREQAGEGDVLVPVYVVENTRLLVGIPRVAERIRLIGIPVDQDQETTSYYLNAGVTFLLNARTSLNARAFWVDEETESPFQTRNYDRFSVWFGVEYRFDPLHF